MDSSESSIPHSDLWLYKITFQQYKMRWYVKVQGLKSTQDIYLDVSYSGQLPVPLHYGYEQLNLGSEVLFSQSSQKHDDFISDFGQKDELSLS
ncbi:Transmembrane 7 Superfamily Member 3 [Manis pentadactyla]|nr:Transmembrane 7 Superfamily Member 3 [Manis pentadactyla]